MQQFYRPGRKLTKLEAVARFKAHVLPSIKHSYECDGKPDYIARSEAWSNFTDQLCKSGYISDRQYMTWHSPAICG